MQRLNKQKLTCVAGILVSMFAVSSLYANELIIDESPLMVFNNNDFPSDLEGNLSASVLFAQSQVMPSKHGVDGDVQPHLIAERTALIMVKPKQSDFSTSTPLYVTATDSGGYPRGTISLNPPSELPTTTYAPDLLSYDVDFSLTGQSVTIDTKDNITALGDSNAELISALLTENNVIKIELQDGRHSGAIYLPEETAESGFKLDGKLISINSKSTVASSIHYGNKSAKIKTNESFIFKHVNGQWVYQGDLDNANIIYAENTWSAKIPANWIKSGLKLSFSHGDSLGELNDIKIGAPTELIINTVDIGMLVEPRNKFTFANDTEAQREYFQVVPVSRMIVNQYEPVHLTEVMLPNGTLLTDYDPNKGTKLKGTMRQLIGKELISIGINNANYGMNSSSGTNEANNPYLAAQLTAHNSRGRYINGVIVHGASGGGGIVTLKTSVATEFSHELGHNFKIGHYNGGFEGVVHSQADAVNSSWGWDADLNKFMPNMESIVTGNSTCYGGLCQEPFYGRSFNRDAMGSGKPFSPSNRYTPYSPHSAADIQKNLESKIVFSPSSETGFEKWNSQTEKMEAYTHELKNDAHINAVIKYKSEVTGVMVNNLTEDYLSSLFENYLVVTVSMSDGMWVDAINVPQASELNKGRSVFVDHKAGWGANLYINDGKIVITKNEPKTYISDGTKWNETANPENSMLAKKPMLFGIPVTTLVGYYDPKGILPSYIYPAMHGSYGFVYGDESETLTTNNCKLQVETETGEMLNFKLPDARIIQSKMNRFHVNIAESSKPSIASIVCNNSELSIRRVELAKSPLLHTEY